MIDLQLARQSPVVRSLAFTDAGSVLTAFGPGDTVYVPGSDVVPIRFQIQKSALCVFRLHVETIVTLRLRCTTALGSTRYVDFVNNADVVFTKDGYYGIVLEALVNDVVVLESPALQVRIIWNSLALLAIAQYNYFTGACKTPYGILQAKLDHALYLFSGSDPYGFEHLLNELTT